MIADLSMANYGIGRKRSGVTWSNKREEQPKSTAKAAEPKGPPRVAIINQTMARYFWPRETAIGKRFTLSDTFKLEDAYEIVGVVGDTRYFGLREATESMIYIPVWRQGADGRVLCVRTARDRTRPSMPSARRCKIRIAAFP